MRYFYVTTRVHARHSRANRIHNIRARATCVFCVPVAVCAIEWMGVPAEDGGEQDAHEEREQEDQLEQAVDVAFRGGVHLARSTDLFERELSVVVEVKHGHLP